MVCFLLFSALGLPGNRSETLKTIETLKKPLFLGAILKHVRKPLKSVKIPYLFFDAQNPAFEDGLKLIILHISMN